MDRCTGKTKNGTASKRSVCRPDEGERREKTYRFSAEFLLFFLNKSTQLFSRRESGHFTCRNGDGFTAGWIAPFAFLVLTQFERSETTQSDGVTLDHDLRERGKGSFKDFCSAHLGNACLCGNLLDKFCLGHRPPCSVSISRHVPCSVACRRKEATFPAFSRDLQEPLCVPDPIRTGCRSDMEKAEGRVSVLLQCNSAGFPALPWEYGDSQWQKP